MRRSGRGMTKRGWNGIGREKIIRRSGKRPCLNELQKEY